MKRRKKQDNYFTEKIAPYYDDIYRYLLHLGCEINLAEDITQETMKAAWENIDDLMDADYARFWMLRVSKNKYISYARLVFHKYEYTDEDFILSDYENSKIINDISDLIIAQESKELIDKALSQMDSKYSDMIRMRYFGEMTYREMSEKLRINENTIRSTVMRGTHRLEKILTDLGYNKEDM